jgi:hypothetical protein
MSNETFATVELVDADNIRYTRTGKPVIQVRICAAPTPERHAQLSRVWGHTWMGWVCPEWANAHAGRPVAAIQPPPYEVQHFDTFDTAEHGLATARSERVGRIMARVCGTKLARMGRISSDGNVYQDPSYYPPKPGDGWYMKELDAEGRNLLRERLEKVAANPDGTFPKPGDHPAAEDALDEPVTASEVVAAAKATLKALDALDALEQLAA